MSTKKDFSKNNSKQRFSREMSPVERYGILNKPENHERTQQSYSLRRRNKLSIDTKNPYQNEIPVKTAEAELDRIKIK